MQNSQQSHGNWNTYIHLPFEYSKTKTEFELELDREYTHKGWSILPTVYPCTVVSLLLFQQFFDLVIHSFTSILLMAGIAPYLTAVQ